MSISREKRIGMRQDQIDRLLKLDHLLIVLLGIRIGGHILRLIGKMGVLIWFLRRRKLSWRKVPLCLGGVKLPRLFIIRGGKVSSLRGRFRRSVLLCRIIWVLWMISFQSAILRKVSVGNHWKGSANRRMSLWRYCRRCWRRKSP